MVDITKYINFLMFLQAFGYIDYGVSINTGAHVFHVPDLIEAKSVVELAKEEGIRAAIVLSNIEFVMVYPNVSPL